jgi:hypothetical protein
MGDVLQITTKSTGGQMVMLSVSTYKAPRSATFEKVGAKIAGGKMYPTLEVKLGEISESYLIEDQNLAAVARTFKKGQSILVRTHSDDKFTWLDFVRSAPPPPPAAKPATPKPAAEGAKPVEKPKPAEEAKPPAAEQK